MASRLLHRWRLLFVLAIGTLAVGTTLQGTVALAATNDEIALDRVPAKVKEAASKAIPGAKWTGANKSVEDGETVYTLEGEDAAKTHVWVDVTADAEITEVGSEIDLAKVPPVVAEALKTTLPQFKVSSAYEARLDGKVIRYYFDGKRPRDKEEIAVSVSPDGKSVKIEED